MDIRDSDVYMVGSMAVPSDTVEEAMGIAAEHLGQRLFAMPDGEVGTHRQMWAPGVGAQVFRNHPDVVLVDEASGFPSVETPLGLLGASRIRPGVEEFSLEGHLPYADAAIAGYQHLREMRERGEVPRGLRFQVALPTAFEIVSPWFGDRDEWPAMYRAYWRAIEAELGRIQEAIPPGELLLQWDFATEMSDIIAAATGRRELQTKLGLTWLPVLSAEETLEAHTALDTIEAMSRGVSDEVTFGYHLCLGTAISFPTTPADDLEWVVRVANTLVERTPHRVDFLHLPVMADSGGPFFAPLADLEVGDARVFLGLGHADGVEGILARGRAAREFLPAFGISNYCGYGRQEADHIHDLLSDLAEGADRLAAERDAR